MTTVKLIDSLLNRRLTTGLPSELRSPRVSPLASVARPVTFEIVERLAEAYGRAGAADVVDVLRLAARLIEGLNPGIGIDKPKWDGDRRELTFRGTLCRRVYRANTNVERLLLAFETAAWPPSIMNPFGTVEQLDETIKSFKVSLESNVICIYRDNLRASWKVAGELQQG